MKLMMGDKLQEVAAKHIVDIKAGRAKLVTGRWYSIECECKDYETVDADEATNIPESYTVCNRCNKVVYLKDLRP